MSLDPPSANASERRYSPRFNAYPPPDHGIFEFAEDGYVCLRINPRWVPFLNGVLDVLREEVYWSERQDFAVNEITELQITLAGHETAGYCGSFPGYTYLVDDTGSRLVDDDGFFLVEDDV